MSLRPSSRGSVDVTALAALLVAMLLWSGTFIAMKMVLTVFHPVLMIFVRMSCSFLIMAPFAVRWIRKTPYSKGDWRLILLLVLAEPCMYFVFEAYALRYTTASQAGVITALLPLLVGVGAFFFLRERLGRKAWLGFFLAVAGVMVLSLSGQESENAQNPTLGNFFEFCAMCMACVYTLCVRKLRGYPPFFITCLQSTAGMVFFGMLALVLDVPLPEAMPSMQPLYALGFLSFSTIVAYGFYNFGIGRLSAGQAAAWINLIPAFTLIMGIVFLGESLTFVQFAALVPIIAGVVLSQMDGLRR